MSQGAEYNLKTIHIKGSKSETIRALLMAGIATGTSFIKNPGRGLDVQATCMLLKQLGVCIDQTSEIWRIQSPGIHQWLLCTHLHCGESALLLRCMAVYARLKAHPCTLLGHGTLNTRALADVRAWCEKDRDYLPFRLQPQPFDCGHTLFFKSPPSSQLISGLMMFLPALINTKTPNIQIKDLISTPYVLMTQHWLKHFGVCWDVKQSTSNTYLRCTQTQYQATQVCVDGDWSSAAFLCVLGAVKYPVKLKGLNTNSQQADQVILKILKQSGANVVIYKDEIIFTPGSLNSFDCDIRDCPDLLPALMVLALFSQGVSCIHGILRTQHKESNRAQVFTNCLMLHGAFIHIQQDQDTMQIKGGSLRMQDSVCFDTAHDHRIAMAQVITAIIANVRWQLNDRDCIEKSYVGFFDDIDLITNQTTKN